MGQSKIKATKEMVVGFSASLRADAVASATLKLLKGGANLPYNDAEYLTRVIHRKQPRIDVRSVAEVVGYEKIADVLEEEELAKDVEILEKNQAAEERKTGHSKVIRINIATLTDETKPQALEAVAAQCEDIYVRDGGLVGIVREAYADENPQHRIAELTMERARMLLGGKMRLGYLDEEGEFGDAPLSEKKDIFSLFLGCGSWNTLRPLKAIISTPFLRPDGTVCQTPSWCPQTKYLYKPGQAFDIAVAENPTPEDAAKALEDLCEPFEEFPFEGDTDVYVIVAAILTLLARPAIRGDVPAFIFDANCAGSGKTLAADAVCMIATGSKMPKSTFTNDDEEQEKKIGAIAREASAVVGFDNIKVGFGGATLEMVLTAGGKPSFRILGDSIMTKTTWESVIIATGNNMEVMEDVFRRVLRCRIVSKVARPEEREIKRKNLLGWCLENRARLVTAGLTLLRAFFVAGCPVPDDAKMLGGFEEWVMVANAVVFAGGKNPLNNRMLAEEEDEDLLHLEIIMDAMEKTREEEGFTASNIMDLAGLPLKKGEGDRRDEHQKMIADAVIALTRRDNPSSRNLGRRLQIMERRVIGEGKKARCLHDKSKDPGNKTKAKTTRHYRVRYLNIEDTEKKPVVEEPVMVQQHLPHEAPDF